MSLEHILLGILRKPASGYDIKAVFDRVFKHFWSAELSQIYRTLKKLEKEKFLTGRAEMSDRGPDKRVYEITRSGRKKLLEWLEAGPNIGSERFTYLAQIYFLGELDDLDASIAFFEQLRDAVERENKTLHGIEDYWKSQDQNYPDRLGNHEFHAQLTLAMGIRKTGALVDWANECIQRLHKRRREAM
ncbi:MAG: PadR family transcriptional regulator [Gammaproteobacteria bacterium]|nr:PadR family transcriptional regulator [Gammaproteobacteria bacterium]